MNTTRRNFLKSTALMGGGLVIGCYIPQTMRLVHAEDDKAPLMNAWLRIGSDNSITLLMAHSEMGQGVYTALPMLIAEELEVAVKDIKLEPVPIVETYNNPLIGAIVTGGSTTVRSRWHGLRQAAAQARHMLIATAAEQWHVKAETCEAKNGQIRHSPTNRTFNYGELAEQAAQKIPPDEVQLKSADEFKVLGQPIPRIDIPAKVNGSAQFGLDVRLPNMLYAAVQQAPVFGSQAKSYDEAAAKAVPGVKAVVKLPNGVAVVASSYWQAQKGVKALNTQFTDTDNSQIDSKTISQELKAGLSAQQAAQAQSKGEDIHKALKAAQDTLEAEYSVPFLAHATMEPMNCTALVEENRCEIWVPTQAQSFVQKKAVAITGLGPEKIKINTTYLGGGFGRRSETDFVEQALLLSQAVKQPVQVVWSREEDMQHDVYRPAAMVKMTAGLDKQGKPTALKTRIVSPSIFARFNPKQIKNGVDHTAVEGIVDMPYNIENQYVDYVMLKTHIPVGFWRSVGHSYTAFFLESFIDELAHHHKQDPYQFRRSLLTEHPDYIKVLETLAERSQWQQPAPKGRHRGMAIHKSFGSIVGEVAEVSVAENAVTIHNIFCVIDCGSIVNPDTINAQMESAIVYGLSALNEAITINKGQVEQDNFDDLQILRLGQMPAIDVHIISSQADPGGVGEPATPPISPAITNAIFAATGKRIRHLPLEMKLLKA